MGFVGESNAPSSEPILRIRPGALPLSYHRYAARTHHRRPIPAFPIRDDTISVHASSHAFLFHVIATSSRSPCLRGSFSLVQRREDIGSDAFEDREAIRTGGVDNQFVH